MAEYDRMQYLMTVGGSLLLSPNAGCLTDLRGWKKKRKKKRSCCKICIITLSPNARHDSAELSAWFRSPFRKSHKLPVYKLIPQQLILRTRCAQRESCGVHNRRFPEITGEDNLTVFSYSERVKSPEWRWQRRRADLRHFEIFRHEPIIIYTRLPAEGTYYPICTFPASSECLIGISDAFSAFCLWVSVIFPTCSLYPQQKRAYSALHPVVKCCLMSSDVS